MLDGDQIGIGVLLESLLGFEGHMRGYDMDY